MDGVCKVKGIVPRRIVRIAVIIIEFQYLMLRYRLRIGQRGTKRSTMIGIREILVQRIDSPQLVKMVDRVVIASAVIDIGRNIHIQGDGPERLFESMPQLQIGPVDVESIGNAARMSVRTVDRSAIVIDRIIGGRRVRIAMLERYIGPEDQRIVAVKPGFQVGKDPVVLASRYAVAATRAGLDRISIDGLQDAVLREGRNMLLIIEIAGRKVRLGA